MSSSIDTLHPYVKQLALKFLNECEKQNFPVQIYFTYRTIEEQNRLYAKGRTKPGAKVTNARGGYSYHNYGLAFDAAPLVNGKIDWNNEEGFKRMGAIGKSVGLEWGGDWRTFKDTPHLQWSGGLTIKQLLSGKRPVTPVEYDIDHAKLLKIDNIKDFQVKMGLDADGIVGPKTKKVMEQILKMPVLRKGSKGDAVKYLQYRLSIAIDGDFGPMTEKALKEWETKNNLTSDGVCMSKDWKVLI